MIKSILTRKVKHKYDVLPPNVQLKINNLNQHLRKLRNTRNATARSHLRAPINSACQDIDTLIKEYRNKKWTDTVQKLNVNDHSAWMITRALINKPTRVPPLKIIGISIQDPQEKTEILAKELKESFTPNASDPSYAYYKLVEENVRNIRCNKTPHHNCKRIYYEAVLNIIRKLKNRKPVQTESPTKS
jgi:hypothetical protein